MADQTASPGGHRRLDRVLDDDFLESVGTVTLPELRDLRAEAEGEEADLSYLRRLLQGRIDIIEAELVRRGRVAAGESSVESLITDLPRILADEQRPAPRGLGRHTSVEPSRVGERRRRVEQLVADVGASDVGSRSDEELSAAVEQLRDAEREVSSTRSRLHQVLDACAAEITRRYRDGEADVSALLTEQPPA